VIDALSSLKLAYPELGPEQQAALLQARQALIEE
jgi:hypothetical protein